MTLWNTNSNMSTTQQQNIMFSKSAIFKFYFQPHGGAFKQCTTVCVEFQSSLIKCYKDMLFFTFGGAKQPENINVFSLFACVYVQ